MNKLTEEKINSLLDISDDYERAYEMVSYLFQGVTDKEGEPYIGHLERVSNRVSNKDTKVAGLLHDVVEDIEGIDFDTLRKLKFNDNVIEMVRIVTHDNNEHDYSKIIDKVLDSNNVEAIKLKYADMSDNFDRKRLSKLDKETQEYLINKYEKQYDRIEKYLKEKDEIQ